MDEKQLSEQESLALITSMINKAKSGFHENGTSSILWGTVIAVCGLTSFIQIRWDIKPAFDIWLLTLAALVPQAIISAKENRNRKVITHVESALNAIWLVYGISIFALIFYCNVVPSSTVRMLADDGIRLIREQNGVQTPFKYSVPSHGSLLLLLYAIPTLATGLIHKFRPMIFAAILCYGFFITSCFVGLAYDMLLNGLAGIFNWLIPGLILRARYQSVKKAGNV